MDNQYQKANTISTKSSQVDDTKLRLQYLEQEMNRLSNIIRQQDRIIRRLSNDIANLRTR